MQAHSEPIESFNIICPFTDEASEERFEVSKCSDSSSLKKELNYLKSIVIKRGFSSSIINQAVKKFTKSPCNSSLSNDIKIKPENSIVLPFYPPLCFKLDKVLKRFNFKVTFKPVNKFNFPSTKSPIP